MPRRFLKKILPGPHALAERWYLRPFAALLRDPVYWTAHRRGVVRAFALGLFICFIPLPVHLLLAPLAAIALRVNVPVTVITVFLVNPLTALPTFFTAYWVGAQLTGAEPQSFQFSADWTWFTHHLAQLWKPLLVGCLVLGVSAALAGYLLLSAVWRWKVNHRYHSRPWKLRRRSAVFDQNTTL